jgi:hypothetical protein
MKTGESQHFAATSLIHCATCAPCSPVLMTSAGDDFLSHAAVGGSQESGYLIPWSACERCRRSGCASAPFFDTAVRRVGLPPQVTCSPHHRRHRHRPCRACFPAHWEGTAPGPARLPPGCSRRAPRGRIPWRAAYAGSVTVIGSIKVGSLFLTLPTRALTGQHVISSAG